MAAGCEGTNGAILTLYSDPAGELITPDRTLDPDLHLLGSHVSVLPVMREISDKKVASLLRRSGKTPRNPLTRQVRGRMIPAISN